MTLTGWIYIPTVGGANVTSLIYWDGGASTDSGFPEITARDTWVKFSLSVKITGDSNLYSNVALWLYTSNAAGIFYIDGFSAVLGSSGGAMLYTPNSNEFVKYTGQATWNPGTVNDGTQVSKDFTVYGAALGMSASAGAGVDVQDCLVSATVTAADTVTVVIRNNTGGNVTLGSSTWYVSATNIMV